MAFRKSISCTFEVEERIISTEQHKRESIESKEQKVYEESPSTDPLDVEVDDLKDDLLMMQTASLSFSSPLPIISQRKRRNERIAIHRPIL